jgi:hypothetical protein
VIENEEKTLAWSTLEASADAIVSGIASKDEVTVALTALQRLTANPPTPDGRTAMESVMSESVMSRGVRCLIDLAGGAARGQFF